jgi:hypothetical protein
MNDVIDGLRRLAPPAIIAATIVISSASAAVAADKPAISTVKGAKYRMADAIMADQVTRYVDPTGDQLNSDGAPVSAPDWTDITSVHVAAARTPAKLRTKMQSDHPPGASDAFYGSEARPRAKDRIIFVAVQTAKRLPANARGQVVEVGLAGSRATPVQVGTETDTLAGVERFSLSGLFRNGAIATGDTDVIGKEPGTVLDDAEFYDLGSGVYGFHDEKKATWYLAIPRVGETDVITVSLQSTTADGLVVDRLDLPGGGHFVDLRNPLGGFKAKAKLSRLGCRAIETFSGSGGVVELSDVDATQIRYTAGVDDSVGQAKREQLLAPAVEAAGPVSVVLTPAGSEDSTVTVEGELTLVPEGNAVSLTFEAPAGQWSFALADELLTAAGEAFVDHSSLTGPAGVLTGPGLDGYVAGDISCVTEEPDAVASPSEEPAAEDADVAADDPAVDDDATDDAPAGDG